MVNTAKGTAVRLRWIGGGWADARGWSANYGDVLDVPTEQARLFVARGLAVEAPDAVPSAYRPGCEVHKQAGFDDGCVACWAALATA
jgi:hypothetical protein